MSSRATRPVQLRVVGSDDAERPSSARLPAPTLDDTELLRGVHEGDPTAATALHDRLRPTVERAIRRLIGAGDRDHEDLAQIAMIEIVTTIDRFRGECPLEGWASTVAAHVVYNQIRRRTTERRIFETMRVDDMDQISSGRSLVRDTSARSILRRILFHLDRIDETKAWAYVLHDVCGYDLKEVATITSSSVSAAQTRLVRGRRELDERLSSDPELGSLERGVDT